MASHLTNIQRDIIAHKHVTGVSAEELAAEFGRSPESMRQMLRSEGMQERMSGWRTQVSAQAERARAFMLDRSLELARQLFNDATHEDPKVRAWALPRALTAVGIGTERAPHRVVYEGVGTVRHQHDVSGEVEVKSTPTGAAVVSALRAVLDQMRDARTIDVTTDRHVLEGEAARPRPEGYEAARQLSATAHEVAFKPPQLPAYAVNPNADGRQGY